MDVLRPTLIRIGGRVYRKNLIQEQAYQHEEEEEDFCAGRVLRKGRLQRCQDVLQVKALTLGMQGALGVVSSVFMCTRACLCGGVRCSRGRKMLCVGP